MCVIHTSDCFHLYTIIMHLNALADRCRHLFVVTSIILLYTCFTLKCKHNIMKQVLCM
jgi:hypothetical protein